MNFPFSTISLAVFLVFVGFVLWLSFYLGKRAKSAQGYFDAHGQVGWFINGVAAEGHELLAGLRAHPHLAAFAPEDSAAWLLAPYLLWVAYASTLNGAIWYLNR